MTDGTLTVDETRFEHEPTEFSGYLEPRKFRLHGGFENVDEMYIWQASWGVGIGLERTGSYKAKVYANEGEGWKRISILSSKYTLQDFVEVLSHIAYRKHVDGNHDIPNIGPGDGKLYVNVADKRRLNKIADEPLFDARHEWEKYDR